MATILPVSLLRKTSLFLVSLLVIIFTVYCNVALSLGTVGSEVFENDDKYFDKTAESCSSSGTERNKCETSGWYTEDSARLVSAGPCNIDIVDPSLTQQQFLDRHAYKKPVIIRRATQNKAFAERTTRNALLEHYGQKEIIVSSANTYSYKKTKILLEDYITNILKPQNSKSLGNETLYWFGDNNVTEWGELFDLYRAPPYTLPGLSPVYSFGVAGQGTGVPFHFHGPGFAEVIHGRKRWFLYAPEEDVKFDPDHSTLAWFLEHYDKRPLGDQLMECTISPGEAIYFPNRWLHGTLNIDTSVFISTFLG